MKGNIPRITLFGSNSGNNLGDAAILSSILESFSKAIPETEFFVPTTKPSFISKNYGEKYNVKPVNIMPWTGSLRFLGIPTLLALKKSDIALICDGIIFGKKLFNPAFNFLIVLIFVVPLARLLGCKVVCYSCGIGPFPTRLGEIFARFVLNSCDLVIMRENDSKALAEQIGVTKPIHVTGDAAFINPVSPDSVGREIISRTGISPDAPIFGVNVTSYFDSWLGKGEKFGSKQAFIDLLVKAIGEAKKECGFEVILFSTHPMDEPAVSEVSERLGAVKIFNRDYLSHDIQAAMRRCGLFMGMRFHSVILASAVETPIISLIYAPKVRGYMRLLGNPELGVELAGLTHESLSKIIIDAWKRRAEIKAKQKAVIDGLKDGAHEACRIVVDRYFGRQEERKAA
jgi:polysaccharide pyruvyl transferase WcaK-like protein